MPDPAASAPPTKPAPEPPMVGNLIQPGRLRWLYRLPLAVSRHARAPPSPGSKGRETARPGISRRRPPAIEAAVRFAGNLTR